jgi:hypothetical protein
LSFLWFLVEFFLLIFYISSRFLVHCSNVCYDFHVKRMFCSSLLPFVLFTFYLCYLNVVMHTAFKNDFHIRWCSCLLTVTWQKPLVEYELLTLQELIPSF